jgi:hypothetical protein
MLDQDLLIALVEPDPTIAKVGQILDVALMRSPVLRISLRPPLLEGVRRRRWHESCGPDAGFGGISSRGFS